MDVRFLLDEHIDHAVGTALRFRGIDALTLYDAGLLSGEDLAQILPFALAETRVLITRDTDFLQFHKQGVPHAGIVFWPSRRRQVRQAIHYLLQLARRETAESMIGQVRYIKDRYP